VIERLPDLARAVPLLQGAETLYEVDLSAVPSWEWRAAFLRPPARHSTSWSLAALDSATLRSISGPRRIFAQAKLARNFFHCRHR
jgi:hypothetical protein